MKQKSIFALVLSAILVLTVSNVDSVFVDYDSYDDDKGNDYENDRNDDKYDDNDDDKHDKDDRDTYRDDSDDMSKKERN